MCFIRSPQNYLSRYHAIISYFSRLPSRKIKTFPVPWVYLIPFPAILKPDFPISHRKKWQIPRPEKALLGPQQLIDNLIHGETKTLIWTQPRPTSKLLCFRRQWWAPPAASPTIADENIIILDVGLGFVQ